MAAGVGRVAIAAVGGVVVLAAELLERLPLGLRDEQGREAAEQHEERVDLEHVVEPRAVGAPGGGAPGAERGNSTLTWRVLVFALAVRHCK